MTASGDGEKIRTREGIDAYCRERFGVDPQGKIAPPPWPLGDNRCLTGRNATSSGVVAWLVARLLELGIYGMAAGTDDAVVVWVQTVGGKRYADIARSKISGTPRIICPIDLTASRVARVVRLRTDRELEESYSRMALGDR